MGTGPTRRNYRQFDVETEDDVTVITFGERKIVTDERIQEVGDDVYSIIGTMTTPWLLLDFSAVLYLSSAGLGKLIIQAGKKARSRGANLMACSILGDLLEVFKITRLDQVVAIFKDREHALSSRSALFSIECPVDRCDGRPLATFAGHAVARGVARCPGCDGRLTLGHAIASREVQLHSVSIPTYDHQWIALDLLSMTAIQVIGRLDLFAFEMLERLWWTVPPPRRIVLDLTRVEDVSRLAIEGLRYLHARRSPDEATGLVIDDPKRLPPDLPGDWTVHQDTWSAEYMLRAQYGSRRRTLRLVIQPI